MVTRKPDRTVVHTVYQKPTHTDRYLNTGSNHHPSQKNGGAVHKAGASPPPVVSCYGRTSGAARLRELLCIGKVEVLGLTLDSKLMWYPLLEIVGNI